LNSDLSVIKGPSETFSRHQTQICCRAASETPTNQRCTLQLTLFNTYLTSSSMPVHAADAQAEEQPVAATPRSSPAGALQKPQPSSSSNAQKRKLTDETSAQPLVDASVTAAAAKRRRAVTAAEQPADSTPTAAAAVLKGPDANQSPDDDEAGHSRSNSESGSSEEADSDEDSSDEGSDGVSGPPPSHPYGVQPWGNYYLSQVPEIRTAGVCVWGRVCVSTRGVLGYMHAV
jgi:hypothetical protein